MRVTPPVLQKDIQNKQTLDSFLQYCEQKQVAALKKYDEESLHKWIKEARLARRELAAMYRAKEKHDAEHERDRKRILGIVQRLKSQGVNAEVVERTHFLTLSEEVS
ncbi:hypothetical protein ABE47_06835 [Bacillus thuringiensis]|uniref:Spore germination protein PF n=1 Tax=Bacillus thuringiensis YBT-1518 TaxID=529122 RepID=A0A9W3KAG4_BACTU|nr:germination protein PF [Bacillus thuringiensis]EKS8365511.1 hypothetical protein [Bacillus cereus]AHA71003.1 spore germination protein PF [Bacillus thuringiensis YBT-1518]MBG9482073.1 hypothetical protein [Bacillus thuringiensis]MBG9511901.1 hypothetical protein [Bacillus thuringiensis]PGL19360.1 hypothetical protein CN916_29045 [Bacillus thuringiensis]